jgi:hypothetical protein
MALDRSKYPLVLLKGIEGILDTFSDIEEQNSEVIIEANPGNRADERMINTGFTPYYLSYIPRDETYDFYFELRGIRFINNVVDYWLVFKPMNSSSVEEAEVTGKLDAAESRLKSWITLLKQYNTVRLSKKDRFTAESAQQFYADFELVDEDADTKPFDNNKQMFLYHFLEHIKKKVEDTEGADQQQLNEIIDEINLLEMHIPVFTKAAVVKGLSKIFAKVQVFSLKLIVDIFDVAKKEIIKAALYGGMHDMQDIIHKLS